MEATPTTRLVRRDGSAGAGPERPQLSGYLHGELQKKGISLKDAARKIGASDSYLRQMFARNRFPAIELSELLNLLELSFGDEELHSRFEFGLVTPRRGDSDGSGGKAARYDFSLRSNELEKALGLMDERLSAANSSELLSRFSLDVSELFGAMSEGDVFCYWSLTELPVEISEGRSHFAVRRSVFDAIHRGAFYFCFFPTDDLLGNSNQDHASGTAFLSKVYTKDWVRMFERFKDDLIYYLAGKHGEKIPSKREFDDATKIADRRIFAIPVSASPYTAPYTKFAMYIPASNSAEYARAVARFPTGTFDAETPFHLPLGREATTALLDFMISTLRKEFSKRFSNGKIEEELLYEISEKFGSLLHQR